MAQPRCTVETELATDEAESHVVRHNNFFSDRLLGSGAASPWPCPGRRTLTTMLKKFDKHSCGELQR